MILRFISLSCSFIYVSCLQTQQQANADRLDGESRTPSTISKEDSVDSILRKPVVQSLDLVLNREDGCPFGLNIAGGLGSSPFVDNDPSIFISKVVSGGLAEIAGLNVREFSLSTLDYCILC